MIIIKPGDILKCNEAQAIIHQANCQCTMGSGVAKSIREKYPEVYMVDCETAIGDYKKLGTFSWIKAKDEKVIYNCYSQFRYGTDRRHTNYEAVYTGLDSIKNHAKKILGLKTLSLPHKMGCALGGGNWNIVFAIIDDIFAHDDDVTLYICKYDK